MNNVLYEQLEKDYCCSSNEIRNNNNIFAKKKLIDGRRRFWDDEYLFKVASLNGKALFCGEENVIGELENVFKNTEAQWLSLNSNLDKLSEIARRYGYRLCAQHHYYLPNGQEAFSDDEIEEMLEGIELKWYDEKELSQFKGDSRFTYALSFLDRAPDVICVTASINNEIVGMAGASADSDTMWQIGINVESKCRGRNIGPLLTILLKRKILEMGNLPFYGTAESHIQSQKVGLKSGFFPAWWEINTEKIK